MRTRLVVTLLGLSIAVHLAAGRLRVTALDQHQESPDSKAGLFVESVGPGSATADAGLRPGDRLVTWERADPSSVSRIVASGAFRTPFDARGFELEQLPRGGTRLVVDRRGTRLLLPLLPGAWDVTVLPMWTSDASSGYQSGLAAAGTGDLASALRILGPVLDMLRTRGRFDDAAWVLSRAGTALMQVAQDGPNQESTARLEGAERLFDAALDEARRAVDPGLEAYVWEARGQAAHARQLVLRGLQWDFYARVTGFDRRDPLFAVAAAAYSRALEIRRTVAPGSLTLAASQFVCADFCITATPRTLAAFSAQRQLVCEAFLARALLAPGSRDHAVSLWSVGRYLDEDAASPSAVNKWSLCPAGTIPPTSEAAATRNRARAILEQVAPNHMSTAHALHELGMELEKLDQNAAASLHRRALALLEGSGLGPGSLVTDLEGRWTYAPFRRFLTEMGQSLLDTGDLDGAEGTITRLRAIWPQAVYPIDTLAEIASRRGDVARAEDLHIQLLAIAAERGTSPYTHIPVARVLMHLAHDGYVRGDLERADALLQRALALEEEKAAGKVGANLAKWKAGLQEARSTSAAQQKRDTDLDYQRCASTFEVSILSRLSAIKLAKGESQAASRFAEQGVALDAACSTWRIPRPPSMDSSPGDLLMRQGEIAAARGEFAAAEAAYGAALEEVRSRAPYAASAALQALGDVRRAAGKPDSALATLEESLALRARQAPGSRWLAETLHGLGLAYRDARQDARAEQSLRAAIDVLDRQRARLGGTGLARLEFAARFQTYYRDYLTFLLEHNRPADAFEVLERSRARTMVEMLAERRVDLAADVPGPLAHQRDNLAADYDLLQDRIRTLDPVKNAADLETGIQHLYQLEGQLDAVAARIQQASPRAAALEYPKPLTAAEASTTLDAGTVLLCYAVGPDRTFLFVVSRAGLSVFTIDVGEKELRRRVEAFRRLLDWQAAGRDDPAVRFARSRELYELLVRPADSLVAPTRRLVLSPDGALSVLPFAALVRGGSAMRPEYLIEWKPLHMTLSATVYASVKARRSNAVRPPTTLVAFGDPRYPSVRPAAAPASRNAPDDDALQALALGPGSTWDPNVWLLTRHGLNLTPLAASRREVEAIGRLFAPSATVYVGPDATEARAKAVGTDTRIIHFAVHGVLTPRFPLNSGLALSIPERRQEGAENGLLQAWEVFARMRIDADLVTLSACESALGAEVGGEGLFGLTRAFEYAGARSVLASLWKVSDEGTFELMTRFYANLKAGQPKDEALRNSELALIRAPANGLPARLSLPAYWAAFQLFGDWR